MNEPIRVEYAGDVPYVDLPDDVKVAALTAFMTILGANSYPDITDAIIEVAKRWDAMAREEGVGAPARAIVTASIGLYLANLVEETMADLAALN